MADERVVTELILEGVQRVLHGFSSVGQAQTNLGRLQEQVGQRQVQTYDQIAKAAEDSARRQQEAAKRTREALERVPTTRARDPQTGRFTTQAQAQAQARLTQAPNVASLGGLTERIAAASASSQTQAAAASQRTVQSTQQLVAALRQLAAISQQAAAAQNVNTQAGARAAAQHLQVAAAATRQANSLSGLVNASSRAQGGGITYLSVLSAIHAASFLATNRTFSLIGSFLTLGLAFSKVGIAASAVGLAFGGLLAIFGQISKGVELVNQVMTTVATTIVGAAAVGTAALVGLGGASVKVAADFETQLAGVRAFTEATTEQLQIVAQQAGELAKRFGISAAEVLKASSLFARAGGSIEDAIAGATEAIIKLQVASQGELQAAEAAILVSAALKQFALDGSEAVRVADALTAAAQSSALSFLGVQQAFIQAAPGARTLGISLEDTAAAVALLGNELIKGTITGTAFKQFLLDIINPSAKAEAELNKYGISVKDAEGKIRPLIDIMGDLNKALGDQAVANKQVTEADRARALAIVFGSRAALAANILTREGAEGLQRFRNKLAETTTTNIVSILLLPLNKQLDILKVSVEELGRAFGGNLLGPIRQAAVAAIQFVQGLEPQIELLGQAVASIATGQGFGALQQKIAEMAGNTALSSFLIELVNTFRNVRDVIVNQIVPAIGQFISILSQTSGEAGRLDDIGAAFAELNTKIQQIGAATAGAIVGLANLIREFIRAEGTGGQLRSTIETLAKVFLIQLAAAMAATAVTVQAAIIAMPILARVVLLTAQAALQLARALRSLAPVLISVTGEMQKLAIGLKLNLDPTLDVISRTEAMTKAFDEVDNQMRLTRGQFHLASDASEEIEGKLATLLKVVEGSAKPFDVLGQASAENARIARSSISDIVDEIVRAEGINVELLTQDEVNALIARAGAMKAGVAGQLNPMLLVIEDVAGHISSSMANILAEIDASQREAAQRGATIPGVIDPEVDEAAEKRRLAAIERARTRIVELANDTARRVQNAMEDMSEQVAQNIEKSLERLDDVFRKANTDIDKLVRDTAERVQEVFEQTTIRRIDRARTDVVKKQVDDELKIIEDSFEARERQEARSLQIVDMLRKHAAEDEEERLKRIVELDEDRYKALQESASKAFQANLEAADKALGKTQDAEEKALKRELDAAAQNRKDLQELADAKTPEDRAKILESQRRARSDRQFQIGQENQLDALKQRHEEQRANQQRGAELATQAFRTAQEKAYDTYRRNNELGFKQIRRQLEAAEFVRRAQEEDRQFATRQRREAQLQAFRELGALKLRKFQDQLEDEANIRQANKIIRDALQRALEIQSGAMQQAEEILTQLEQQTTAQEAQLEKTLRNIQQAFDDFKDSIPADVRGSVIDQLNQAMAELEGRSARTREELARVRAQARGSFDVSRAQLEASLQLRAPTEAQFRQSVPTNVQANQVIQAASVILPVGFAAQVAGGVRLGIAQAVQQGLLPDGTSLDIDLTGITGPLQNIQNAPIFRR